MPNSFEISFNGIPLNAQSIEIVSVDGQIHKFTKCERCYNRQPHTEKIIPTDPETFCDPCTKKFKALLQFTEE